MKLFKKVIAVVAIATMSLTMVACGNAKAATEMTSEDEKGLIVARVEGEPIYKTDFENAWMQTAYYMQMVYGVDITSNPEMLEQAKESTLESMIQDEILLLKAKEMKNIKVDQKEIDEQFEAIKANYTEEEFKAALEESEITEDDLKQNIEKSLLVEKLMNEYVENKVKLTDEDIESYYNENIANYTKKPGANISHILLETEEEAKEVLAKYNAGTGFTDLSTEYSKDTAAASQGGSLGFIEYDTTSYDADFMAGAKELGEGEISEPVKTQFGWHLIKVDGIQNEEVVQPLEEVKETIETTLRKSKAQTLLLEDLEKWKEEVEIIRYEENYKEVAKSEDEAATSDSVETTDEVATNDSTEMTDGAATNDGTEDKSEATSNDNTEASKTNAEPSTTPAE